MNNLIYRLNSNLKKFLEVAKTRSLLSNGAIVTSRIAPPVIGRQQQPCPLWGMTGAIYTVSSGVLDAIREASSAQRNYRLHHSLYNIVDTAPAG